MWVFLTWLVERTLVFLSLVYVDVGLNVGFLWIFLFKYHGSLCTSSFRELYLKVGLCVVDKLEVVGSCFVGRSCSGRAVLIGVVNLCEDVILYFKFCFRGSLPKTQCFE